MCSRSSGGRARRSRGIRGYADTGNTITGWTDVEGRGWHFAALEEPELLTCDIRTFIRDLR
jgi:epoxide hydrolase